jgi:hypothetical protein
MSCCPCEAASWLPDGVGLRLVTLREVVRFERQGGEIWETNMRRSAIGSITSNMRTVLTL